MLPYIHIWRLNLPTFGLMGKAILLCAVLAAVAAVFWRAKPQPAAAVTG